MVLGVQSPHSHSAPGGIPRCAGRSMGGGKIACFLRLGQVPVGGVSPLWATGQDLWVLNLKVCSESEAKKSSHRVKPSDWRAQWEVEECCGSSAWGASASVSLWTVVTNSQGCSWAPLQIHSLSGFPGMPRAGSWGHSYRSQCPCMSVLSDVLPGQTPKLRGLFQCG